MGVADLRSILSGIANTKSGGGSNSGGSIDLSLENLEKIIVTYYVLEDDEPISNVLEITEFNTEDSTPLNLSNNPIAIFELVYPQIEIVIGPSGERNYSIVKNNNKFEFFWAGKYLDSLAPLGIRGIDVYWRIYHREFDSIEEIFNYSIDMWDDYDNNSLNGFTLIHEEYLWRETWSS